MNWHETILMIQENPNFKGLVKEAYFEKNVITNIERYKKSREFREIKKIIINYFNKDSIKILDVGAGNGIAALAFESLGHSVTVVEPDNSDVVGTNAIKKAAEYYSAKIEIVSCYFEELSEKYFNTFDLVFARQAMHHADNLDEFLKTAFNVLKPNGRLITIRDHVVKNAKEKELFLKKHPLHKFYGGENAYSLKTYKERIIDSGFKLDMILKPSDSIINLYPWDKNKVEKMLGFVGRFKVIVNLMWLLIKYKLDNQPGRLYSFIAHKQNKI